MTKDKFNVRINSIYVAENGDTFGNGEIFFSFFVDFNPIVEIQYWHSISVPDGGYINHLYANRDIEKKSNESFRISGNVADDDDFLTGSVDNAGDFMDVYEGKNSWWLNAKVGDVLNVAKRLTGDGMDVTLNYSIEFLSSEDLDYPNLNPGSQTLKQNIADGGAILYYGVDYNQRLDPIQKSSLSMSQFFKNGDFNLPKNITLSITPKLSFTNKKINYIIPGLDLNTLSSLRLGTNKKIILFDRQISERHLGKSLEITEDTPFLNIYEYNEDENGWNNKAVSIRIEDYYPMPH